jgi:hypothetical protein
MVALQDILLPTVKDSVGESDPEVGCTANARKSKHAREVKLKLARS